MISKEEIQSKADKLYAKGTIGRAAFISGFTASQELYKPIIQFCEVQKQLMEIHCETESTNYKAVCNVLNGVTERQELGVFTESDLRTAWFKMLAGDKKEATFKTFMSNLKSLNPKQ